jgi:hypothetical protein
VIPPNTHKYLYPTMVAKKNVITPPRVRLATGQHRVLLYITCYNVLDGYVSVTAIVRL